MFYGSMFHTPERNGFIKSLNEPSGILSHYVLTWAFQWLTLELHLFAVATSQRPFTARKLLKMKVLTAD
jgi:hypothetical protein